MFTPKIFGAVSWRGIGQSESTRLFNVSLCSVKRYLRKSPRKKIALLASQSTCQ
jgi:hypothetical protein